MSLIESKSINLIFTIERVTESLVSPEDYVYSKLSESGLICYFTNTLRDRDGDKVYTKKGTPDLIIFDKEGKIIRYVEVKSPGDKLSMEQLKFIMENNQVPYEVYWLKLEPLPSAPVLALKSNKPRAYKDPFFANNR